jgi:phospholipid transport system substrate-binding protein
MARGPLKKDRVKWFASHASMVKTMQHATTSISARPPQALIMIARLNRSRSSLCIAAGALGIAAILLIVPAPEATAAQDAGTFVAALGTQGVQALGPDISAPERLSRLRQLLQQDFDISGIGLFALGRYRLSATAEEQLEFFRLYPDFTVRAFSFRLNEYGGASFRVIGSRVAGNDTVVNSEIRRGDGNRVTLDWSLTEIGGQYRITDVAVGGVSMKVTLRDQFASWIANNGGRFGALLAVLRQQTAQVR